MKIIDLLNKIANGEEVPQLIKWNGYVYDKLGCEYYMLNDRDITLFGDILDTNGKYLNDDVEIIEEEKKIPEKVPNAEVFDVPKLNNMELSNIALTNKEDIKFIKETLNLVLDYLKSKGE